MSGPAIVYTMARVNVDLAHKAMLLARLSQCCTYRQMTTSILLLRMVI